MNIKTFNPGDWSYTHVGKGLICDITGKACFAKHDGCIEGCTNELVKEWKRGKAL